MARNTSGGPWYALSLGLTHHNKVASLGAGNYLTEVNCQGLIAAAVVAVNLTAGNNGTYNLVAGLQYGAAGYTPGDVTNGTPGANNWLTWASGLPPAGAVNANNGTSPLAVVEQAGYSLDVRWRGLWYFPSATDVYLVIGMDQSQPVHATFAPFYNHWAVWVS